MSPEIAGTTHNCQLGLVGPSSVEWRGWVNPELCTKTRWFGYLRKPSIGPSRNSRTRYVATSPPQPPRCIDPVLERNLALSLRKSIRESVAKLHQFQVAATNPVESARCGWAKLRPRKRKGQVPKHLPLFCESRRITSWLLPSSSRPSWRRWPNAWQPWPSWRRWRRWRRAWHPSGRRQRAKRRAQRSS